MNALASYLKQFSKTTNTGPTTTSTSQFKPTDILGDLHLLRYLAINDIISFSMVDRMSINIDMKTSSFFVI